jgi:hypothetical protein
MATLDRLFLLVHGPGGTYGFPESLDTHRSPNFCGFFYLWLFLVRPESYGTPVAVSAPFMMPLKTRTFKSMFPLRGRS